MGTGILTQGILLNTMRVSFVEVAYSKYGVPSKMLEITYTEANVLAKS
jgi:hypothetical protein